MGLQAFECLMEEVYQLYDGVLRQGLHSQLCRHMRLGVDLPVAFNHPDHFTRYHRGLLLLGFDG